MNRDLALSSSCIDGTKERVAVATSWSTKPHHASRWHVSSLPLSLLLTTNSLYFTSPIFTSMARRKRAAARPRKTTRTRVRKEASVPPSEREVASATPPEVAEKITSTADLVSTSPNGVPGCSGPTHVPSVVPPAPSSTETAGTFIVSDIVAIHIDASMFFRRRSHHF